MKEFARATRSLVAFQTILVFFLAARPLPAQSQSAQEIVRKVVDNELHFDATDHKPWMYRDAYKSPDKDTVKLVIQTRNGNLSEIVQDHGQPPTPDVRQADLARMQQTISDPSFRERQRRNEDHDNQQAVDMMKMLPNAFLWHVIDRHDEDLTLSFVPNPSFSADSMNGRVMAAMSGTMVVDERQMRLKSLQGHLNKPVEFGWGLLGHLNAGGTFQIIRAEVAPGEWQIVQTHVHISGHALFFKSIGDQEDETDSDFRPVPDGVDLNKAAEMLRSGEVARTLDTSTTAQR